MDVRVDEIEDVAVGVGRADLELETDRVAVLDEEGVPVDVGVPDTDLEIVEVFVAVPVAFELIEGREDTDEDPEALFVLLPVTDFDEDTVAVGVLEDVFEARAVPETEGDLVDVLEADEVCVPDVVFVIKGVPEDVRDDVTVRDDVPVAVEDLVADGEVELDAVDELVLVTVDVADILEAEADLVAVLEEDAVIVAFADLVAVRVNVALLVGLTPSPPAKLRRSSVSSSAKDDLEINSACPRLMLKSISFELSTPFSADGLSEIISRLLLEADISED